MAHCLCLFVLCAVASLHHALQLDAAALVYPSCLVLTLAFLWILTSWYLLRRNLFEPYSLFMISAGLFNGGQAVLELLGLNHNGMLDGRFAPEVLVESLFLVTLSALALHTGAILAIPELAVRTSPRGSPVFRERATRLAGWVLLAVSIVPTYLYLKDSVDVVLDFGYMALYRRDQSYALIWALSGFFVPGIIFLLAGARDSRGIQWFCMSIAAAFMAINLFLGARGAAVMSGAAVAWTYERVAHKIPRKLLVVLVVLALIIFSLIRETRNTEARWRLSLDQQIETLTNLQDPISKSIAEMGYSLVTVAHTLTLVPAIRDYDLGVSYFYGATTIIPNLGWEVHPGIAHGLLCDWLTRTVEPLVAASGGGLGFSFIAEAYLNFGWIGGPIFLAIVGYLLSRLFLQADSQDPARLALVASFLSFFLVFARGESAIVVRGLVWYAVLPYLAAAALSRRERWRLNRR
jgi:oligosaccharide repeat unit polymerase